MSSGEHLSLIRAQTVYLGALICLQTSLTSLWFEVCFFCAYGYCLLGCITK